MSRNVQLGQTGQSGLFAQSHVEGEREAKYVSNGNYYSDSLHHFQVRECVLPASRNGGTQCAGPSDVTEDCNKQTCPDWSEWSDWTQCTQTCGGGQKSRQRDCLLNYERGSNEFGCNGESDDTAPCNSDPCPVWTDWSMYKMQFYI